MKILSLHIYGFGQHVDREISNISRDFQFFSGENEAGKSTLMTFIHAILFGFSTRSQQSLYVPKQGLKYGGKIILEVNGHGIVIIERIFSSPNGTLTIFMEDGSQVDEQFLNELFKGMDASIFQSIFYFDLNGLQEVESVKAEDFGNYLFSSGIVGKQALNRLEKKLDQRLDHFFKPNGRKPVLNELLHELEDENKKLLEWERNLDEYNILQSEIEKRKDTIFEIEQQRETNIETIKNYQVKVMLFPYWEEYKQWKSRLEHLPNYIPFPEDGLERLKTLENEMISLKRQYAITENKKGSLEDALKDLTVREEILTAEKDLNWLFENQKLYEHDKQESGKVNKLLQQKREEITKIEETIGLETATDQIMHIDTSLSMKQRLKDYFQLEGNLNQKRELLDRMFEDAKREIEHCESKIAYYLREKLPEEEREKIFLNVQSEIGSAVNINENKSIKAFGLRPKQTYFFVSIFSILSFMGVSFYLQLALEQILFIALFMMALLSILFLLFNKRNTEIMNQLLTMEKNRISETEQHFLRDKLKKDDSISHALDSEKLQLTIHEKKLHRTITDLEEWEQEKHNLQEEFKKLKAQLFVPMVSNGERLMEVFDLIRVMKNLFQEINSYKQQVVELSDRVGSYEREVRRLTALFHIAETDIVSSLFYLKQAYNTDNSAQQKRTYLIRQLKEMEDEAKGIKEQLVLLQGEKEKLFAAANVTDEEAYRVKGNACEEAQKIRESLQRLEGQMDAINTDREIRNSLQRTERSYQEKIHVLEEKNKELNVELKRLYEQQTKNQLQLSELEKGTVHSDILHSFEAKRTVSQDYFRKWVIIKIAKDILLKAKEEYQKHKLPAVIQKATRFFDDLTNGTYQRLHILEEEESIRVERCDGTMFYPRELSRATAEQLYLSIRLALASVYEAKSPYPIIIDDSFVNFDEKRLEKAMRLLNELSKEHQILYFTCHSVKIEKATVKL